MKTNKFTGIITALVTPFKEGKVDIESLKKIIRFQVESGVEGIVINGTTAESPNLSASEVKEIVKIVRSIVGDLFPLILGTGSNSTAKTIEATQRALELGADAALVVVPYYNKPPQRGLVAHFKAVASAVNIPIILYNVPGRTVVSMTVDTVVELSQVKNIIGIKEASGDMGFAKEILSKAAGDFILLSGDDATCVEQMLLGGQGVISVISHIIPEELRVIADAARGGDERARTEYKKFYELNMLMGIEPNPMPVKRALQIMNIITTAEMRLPLVELNKQNTEKLISEIKRLGLSK